MWRSLRVTDKAPPWRCLLSGLEPISVRWSESGWTRSEMKRTFADINIFSLIKQDGESRTKRKTTNKTKGRKKNVYSGFCRSLAAECAARGAPKSIRLLYAGANIKKRSMNIKRQKLDEFLKKILSLMYRHQQKHDPAHAAAHAKSFKLIYCKYCSSYFGSVVCFHPAAFMSRQWAKIIFRFPETLNVSEAFRIHKPVDKR